MGAAEANTTTPIVGDDPVSRSLNEFFTELNPENKEPYVGLRLHLIRPDSIPGVSFYVKRGKRYRIFRDQRESFSAFEIQSLLDSGIDRIYLDRHDSLIIRQYLETFLGQSTPQQYVSMEAQVGLMRSAAVRLTEELFQDPSPENIRKGMKAVTGFVNVLVRDPKAFYHLIRLSSHDHYTYQHSVGVGLNAIALGKRLKLASDQDLVDLGIAGLLHDIGKTKVAPEIINKPGPLDKDEWDEMRQHSTWGYEILKDNRDVSQRAKLAVLHHHEENSGGGYPHGLTDNQISVFAKIVTIADIFNALTTDRTYSKAKTPFESFKLIQTAMMHKVDKQLFAELVMVYGGKLE
ncbi:MAG: HD-GYP domain-containing protein [Proteobacteria bacterium]|nr:MAG: HD-GYP domain-containing protein [Pseudomonadota bacterium]